MIMCTLVGRAHRPCYVHRPCLFSFFSSYTLLSHPISTCFLYRFEVQTSYATTPLIHVCSCVVLVRVVRHDQHRVDRPSSDSDEQRVRYVAGGNRHVPA